MEKCPDWQKHVVVVLDEMYIKEDLVYIKEDLVYNKHTGALVGFSDLGDINDHLLQFQSSLEIDSSKPHEQLATCGWDIRAVCPGV